MHYKPYGDPLGTGDPLNLGTSKLTLFPSHLRTRVPQGMIAAQRENKLSLMQPAFKIAVFS